MMLVLCSLTPSFSPPSLGKLASLMEQRQSSANRAAIEEIIGALPAMSSSVGDAINGRWKLRWSSQTADVNPLATPDSVLGGCCYQDIELDDGVGRLDNIVEWAEDWRLVGGAAVAPAGGPRSTLSVDSAVFELGGALTNVH